MHAWVPISTTTAGELLRSLTLYNDMKCTTVNGSMINAYMTDIDFMQNSFVKYLYLLLQAAPYNYANITSIWLHCNN